ncbi:Exonuclease [Trypanosoma melophagium]|uniref:Exonuclease n=1 Tax=Trypanosoma melophagium TaxID=715481 RepID=UPI00351A5A79|nr:Exonuclease [Trypanosoma melophagium]
MWLDSLRGGGRKRSRVVAANTHVTADAVKSLPSSWRLAINNNNNNSNNSNSNNVNKNHPRDVQKKKGEEKQDCSTSSTMRDSTTHAMPFTRHGSNHVQPIKPNIRPPELLHRTILHQHPPTFLTALCMDVETTGFSIYNDDIVSIAAVELRWDAVLLRQWCFGARSFFRVVRPTRASDPRAQRVHGYTEAELRKAPPIEDVMQEFAVFISQLRGDDDRENNNDNDTSAQRKEEGKNENDTLYHNTDKNGKSQLKSSDDDQQKCPTLTLPPVIAHNAQFDASFLQRQSLNAGWRLVWDKQSPLMCTQSVFRALYPHQAADLTRACQFLGIDVAGRSVQHNAFQDAQLCGRLFLRLSEKWHSVST